VNLETSSLSGWVGATAAALQPLVDALATRVVASDTLHVDDIGVPVLARPSERLLRRTTSASPVGMTIEFMISMHAAQPPPPNPD
jgi:transposase IS66 family protein